MHGHRKIIRDTIEPMRSVNRDSRKFSRLLRGVIRASALCLLVTVNIMLKHV